MLDLTLKMLDVDILLLSPFYISRANTLDTVRRKFLMNIPIYIERVEKLSNEFSTLYINLHEIFQERLKYLEPGTFAPEPTHSNRTGHLLIAFEAYNKLVGRYKGLHDVDARKICCE